MEIDTSKLYNDILDIANLPAPDNNYSWHCEILADGEIVQTIKVLSVHSERDYRNNYSDVLMLEVSIGMGTYATKIYPFKEKLKAVLYRKSTFATGDKLNEEIPTHVKTYACSLANEVSPSITSSSIVTGDEVSGDRSSIFTLDIQLTNVELEEIRTVEVGGIYRKVTVFELLQTLMLNNAKPGGPPPPPVPAKIYKDTRKHVFEPVTDKTGKTVMFRKRWESDGFKGIAGVNIIEPSNTHRYEHIVITPGTKLVDLPTYLQEKYGVYSSGIGYYLYRGLWYIYPKYDFNRFTSTVKTATIANIPAHRMQSADKTFQVKDSQVYILATGDVKHTDTSEQQQLNDGNGYRMLRSENVIDVFSTTSKNKSKVVRKDNMIETVVETRSGNMNHVFFSKRMISDNVAAENSKLAPRVGGFIQLQWENSSGELIYPGMPFKLLYMKHNKVIEVLGVVVQMDDFYALAGNGPIQEKHQSTSVITLFIKRESV